MKIDFSQKLKMLDGSDIEPPTTLGKVSSDALLHPQILDDKPDGEEKVKRFLLATRVAGKSDKEAGVVDLKSEEITKIKTLVGKVFPPLVVGQAWGMLENEPTDRIDA